MPDHQIFFPKSGNHIVYRDDLSAPDKARERALPTRALAALVYWLSVAVGSVTLACAIGIAAMLFTGR